LLGHGERLKDAEAGYRSHNSRIEGAEEKLKRLREDHETYKRATTETLQDHEQRIENVEHAQVLIQNRLTQGLNENKEELIDTLRALSLALRGGQQQVEPEGDAPNLPLDAQLRDQVFAVSQGLRGIADPATGKIAQLNNRLEHSLFGLSQQQLDQHGNIQAITGVLTELSGEWDHMQADMRNNFMETLQTLGLKKGFLGFATLERDVDRKPAHPSMVGDGNSNTAGPHVQSIQNRRALAKLQQDVGLNN
jgi:flagellin-specific chaperone FliS